MFKRKIQKYTLNNKIQKGTKIKRKTGGHFLKIAVKNIKYFVNLQTNERTTCSLIALVLNEYL